MSVRIQPRPLAWLAHNAGFRDDDLFVAVAVANAESHSYPDHSTPLPDGSKCLGLMGLIVPPPLLGTSTETDMLDPVKNMQTAFTLWAAKGWSAWSSFNAGQYLLDGNRQWALLAVSNRWGEVTDTLARAAGIGPATRVPWISLSQDQKLYPSVTL